MVGSEQHQSPAAEAVSPEDHHSEDSQSSIRSLETTHTEATLFATRHTAISIFRYTLLRGTLSTLLLSRIETVLTRLLEWQSINLSSMAPVLSDTFGLSCGVSGALAGSTATAAHRAFAHSARLLRARLDVPRQCIAIALAVASVTALVALPPPAIQGQHRRREARDEDEAEI